MQQRNYDYQDLHPVNTNVRKQYARIAQDEAQGEPWNERPIRQGQGYQDRRPRGGRDKRRQSPRSPLRGNGNGGRRNEERFSMDIKPLMVIWLDYTKQFYRMREQYRVKVMFQRYDVEFVGSREAVGAAVRYTEELLDEYDYMELRIPNMDLERSKNKNLYRPFVEATHTKEFEQMQQRDRGLCLLVPYKVGQLSGKLYNQFRYEGAEHEKRKLPYNYALLFCKRVNQEEFSRQINQLVEMIANLLWNNITPMQAPRFNSRGMMNYRSDIYKNQKTIAVEKLDAVWLAQFDKLELLSKRHKVYIKLEDHEKQNEDVNIVVKSNKPYFIEGACKMILDEYLRKLMMIRVNFEFAADTNFQDVVTKDMRQYIEEGVRQRLPKMSLAEIKSHRFIDSNEMYLTAQELDDYYKTTIVQHLDDKQRQHKYLYILGLNALFPHVVELAVKYLQESANRQRPFSLNDPNQSYLQNDFDESRIMEDGPNERPEPRVTPSQPDEPNDERKRFRVVQQTRDAYTVLVYNTSEEHFKDDRFLNQKDLAGYLKSHRFTATFMVSQQNKTLLLDVEGTNPNEFIVVLDMYFNHAMLVQVSQSVYAYLVEHPVSLIEQIVQPNFCIHELVAAGLTNDFDQSEYYIDEPAYAQVLKLGQHSKPIGDVVYFINLLHFPHFERTRLLQQLRLYISEVKQRTFETLLDKLPDSVISMQQTLQNLLLLNPLERLDVEELAPGQLQLSLVFSAKIEEEDRTKITARLRTMQPSQPLLPHFEYNFRDLNLTQRMCERLVHKLQSSYPYRVAIEFNEQSMRLKGQQDELLKFDAQFHEVLKDAHLQSSIISSQSSSFLQIDDTLALKLSTAQYKYLQRNRRQLEDDFLVKIDMQPPSVLDSIDFDPPVLVHISGTARNIQSFLDTTPQYLPDELPEIRNAIHAQFDNEYAQRILAQIGQPPTNYEFIAEVDPNFFVAMRRQRFIAEQKEHVFVYETKVLQQGQIEYQFPHDGLLDLQPDQDYMVGLLYGNDTSKVELRDSSQTLIMRYTTRRVI